MNLLANIASPAPLPANLQISTYGTNENIAGEEIRHMLSTTPMAEAQDGTPVLLDHLDVITHCMDTSARKLRLARLENLHRILCGSKPPSTICAVENGPGIIAHTAMALTSMGTRVIVKETDVDALMFHGNMMLLHGTDEMLSRLSYANLLTMINSRTPAQVVYWSNPSPLMSATGKASRTLHTPFDKRYMLHYLGRDVTMAGFLVIQSHDQAYTDIAYDPLHWRLVLSIRMNERGRDSIQGTVLPTHYDGVGHTLTILQRLEEPNIHTSLYSGFLEDDAAGLGVNADPRADGDGEVFHTVP